ncbi:MAG: hypothetical protein ACRENI_01665, partial [Gemmatimonadaceae bacterium]
MARLTVSGNGQSVQEGGTLNLTINPGDVVTFTLDGTRSTAETGSITSYEWSSNGTVTRTGATATFGLNAGTHVIGLK